MTSSEAWYIIKQPEGHCEVVLADPAEDRSSTDQDTAERERWGPFDSQSEAIARRVGLIRAGKCQPI
jgi:hypothetical protein